MDSFQAESDYRVTRAKKGERVVLRQNRAFPLGSFPHEGSCGDGRDAGAVATVDRGMNRVYSNPK